MKSIFLSLVAACMLSGAYAQTLSPIQLKAPEKKAGLSVMETLANRHSTREFSNKKLTLQELSNVLWAANGINRPEKGMRTAPSAMNAQEVDVYVCMEEGAFLYDAKSNQLQPVIQEDLRGLVGGKQAFVINAPVVLLMVSDLSKLPGGNSEQTKLMAAIDAGIVSQNISIACSGLGLITVPRASMDKEALAQKLKLKSAQLLLMNNPVGKE